MAIWDIKEIYKKERAYEWVNRGDRCVFAGGNPSLNTIDYMSAAAGGTAADFGDLTVARGNLADNYGTHVRGIVGGGSNTNTIDYITMATTGDAADFGDLLQTRRYVAGTGNTVRGVYGGGISSDPSNSGLYNIIEFLTPTSTGNTADFGDLIAVTQRLGGFSSPTRMVWAGGMTTDSAQINVIQYVSIASTGNAIDFGDLTTVKYGPLCASSAVRGLAAGGQDPNEESDNIDYVTIATLGDAADFGDLPGSALASQSAAGGTGATRGLFGGSEATSTAISMVTISTTGDSKDFADLSVARAGCAGMSTGHGGLDVDNVQRPSVTYMPGSGRVLTMGGTSPGTQMYLIHITTLGSALDFGDLVIDRQATAGASSLTRGFTFGGTSPAKLDSIESVEFKSLGTTADFGNLTGDARSNLGTGHSNTTRALCIGGHTDAADFVNTIDYITMATAGNAADFGDLTVSAANHCGTGSITRAVMGGGMDPGQINVIDYVTIASTGDATDFGDLTVARGETSTASSSTRGVFMGGRTDAPSPGTALNTIDYVTISSTGDATDFGDTTVTRRGDGAGGSGSNSIRGIAMGGQTPTVVDTIDYITIATTGDATDFGDLPAANSKGVASASDSHGGLQH